MSATSTPPARTAPAPSFRAELRAHTVPVGGFVAIAGVAISVGALSWLVDGTTPNWTRWAIVAVLVNTVVGYAVVRRVEGPRKAVDRLATLFVSGAFLLVAAPLLSVIWTVASKGAGRMDAVFFTETSRGLIGEGGGVYHAIVGTLIVTGFATLLSVPIGLFTAIYLVEYGKGRLARAITGMVDVMTGIPSIVAGLFAYALFAMFLGPGTRIGIAGSVSLAVLMTPIVVRSSEEMLRLVPNELREAAYALGVPKWKTIVRIVLPTSIAGILTGVSLAVARVIGETAPLLVAAGLAQDTNYNAFEGRMTTLPVYTYYSYVQPGFPPEAGEARAWAAALTLVIVVAVLFTVGRVLARIFTPKGLR